MSRLTELIRLTREKDPVLASELEREFKTMSGRRAFGLNFERHRPEAVELPQRPVRRGDKVRVLPERGSTEAASSHELWRVVRIERTGTGRAGHLRCISDDTVQDRTVSTDDLVVVAEFRDPIYPGLVSTGSVGSDVDKPLHTVINGENYHVLKALTYSRRGAVDAIYIDPPYNTGAKDWKYNNNYVEGDDLYRHSKWLAFMERRLLLAQELLNPEESALVVTIDEKEYLRLGLLLEQIFPEASIQMVSININPKGTSRPNMFSRVDEFAYFVLLGSAAIPDVLDVSSAGKPVRWRYLRREDDESARGSRPRQFYPVFVDPDTRKIVDVGSPLDPDIDRTSVTPPDGLVAVFPVREDGKEMEWGLTGPSLLKASAQGFARATPGHEMQPFIVSYLTGPNIKKVKEGTLVVKDVRPDGSKVVVSPDGKASRPKTVWQESRHSAGDHGTKMLNALLPERDFPFPKSVYAVEDTLRLLVGHKPAATVLDFFAGSGTTAHAVMRLNKQDQGRRQCISVTNNEVSADEQQTLRDADLRPGDPAWEEHGICDFITKPRIRACITGETPAGVPVEGDYKFTDEFPLSDGFEEGAEFFTLTYEAPLAVGHNRAFERIAPILWIRAGSKGRRINSLPDDGWDVAETYGILFDLDKAGPFVAALEKSEAVELAFVVTDDDRRFQSVIRDLPKRLEPVRLYESYLSNFRFANGE